MTPAELADLRRDYTQRGLYRADLLADPIAQFAQWIGVAHENHLPEPNAMTLATIDATGQPWSRTVLLKAFDQRGFAFFTNYDGAKAHHLQHDARGALTFWWAALERQVNVTGTLTKTSREESETYFSSRPPHSQLGAWASRQSEVVSGRSELEEQLEEARLRFGESNIPTPPHWGGYWLRPRTVEFWQGRTSRLHDRLRYSRVGESEEWTVERLSP